jgi:hypothetical protein
LVTTRGIKIDYWWYILMRKILILGWKRACWNRTSCWIANYWRSGWVINDRALRWISIRHGRLGVRVMYLIWRKVVLGSRV